ncbi:MAG: zf-HC2 domain-containing protein [Candidatus Latescibacterota bacterium]
MNCAACERHLSAYIDDELGAEVRLEIESHLDACAACRRDLHEHLVAWEAALQIVPGRAPERLWEGVTAALEEAPASATTLEDLALMLRGLAGQVQDLQREVAALRREVAAGAGEREAEEDIRVQTRPFAAGRRREASIEQLRRIS